MSQYYIQGKEFLAPKLAKGLYIVATPIGNLRDISLRALETLASADLIICEDTRTSAKLLNHYGIKTKRKAFHEHNEKDEIGSILQRLKEGQAIALISDAGTPLISDPGFPLVRIAREENIDIFAIAGASALIAALSIAGLPTDSFSFFGFLPNKSSARKTYLKDLKQKKETLLFYESPRRLFAAISDMAEVFGDNRQAIIALEISKKFERVMRGCLVELKQQLINKSIKGEAVILIEGATEIAQDDNQWKQHLKQTLAKQSLKDAVSEIAKKYNIKRKQVYDEALKFNKTTS